MYLGGAEERHPRRVPAWGAWGVFLEDRKFGEFLMCMSEEHLRPIHDNYDKGWGR